jgi:hypothetical protein
MPGSGGMLPVLSVIARTICRIASWLLVRE